MGIHGDRLRVPLLERVYAVALLPVPLSVITGTQLPAPNLKHAPAAVLLLAAPMVIPGAPGRSYRHLPLQLRESLSVHAAVAVLLNIRIPNKLL